MATQILRTVDRWRFEAPLALALAAATGFATLAMPREIFGRLPVAGALGTPGHIGLAVVLAIVCGVVGYVAMRRPAKAVPVDEDAELTDEDLDTPSGMSEDRLLRLRRADRHPDAPPRAPIRASRDLGEPFMDVAAFVPTSHAAAKAASEETVSAEPAIIDGDYVELDEPVEQPTDAADLVEDAPVIEPVAEDIMVEAATDTVADEPALDAVAEEPVVAPTLEPVAERAADAVAETSPAQRRGLGEPFVEKPVVAAVPVVEMPAAAPIVPPVAAVPRQDTSIAAMMERLSAGMERRGGRPTAPARDMRPALRDALDELNRLAERRG